MIKEFQGENRWLSNFWPVQIEYKGRTFANIENAYHSEKNNTDEWKDFCATESDPRAVKPRSLEVDLRSDWDVVKVDTMINLTRIKYQNLELREKLISTGDTYLQEGNDWGDVFWGVDLETGEGENNFGKIIMKIRKEIRDNG